MSLRHSLALGLALGGLLGCSSYEPRPLEPRELLDDLRQVRLDALSPSALAPITSAFEPSDGLTRVEASAVAARLNPRLRALRAAVGVAESRLIQAGLLPDPVLSWDAMDAAAGAIAEGKAESASWLAGFGLSWQVPRPDEIDAREGVARADLRASAVQLVEAEWSLVRDAQLAYVRLLVARASVAQTERLASVARRALAFFERARASGAATGLEEALARTAALSVGADVARARNEEERAAMALNALLGLPPDARFALQDRLEDLPPARDLEARPGPLVEAALRERPDLQAARAGYQRAEEQLRLEVARQWPQLQIGTGISLQLPVFSRFNHPGVAAAQRARDAARARVLAATHGLRASIHLALARARQAGSLLELYRRQLGPQVEASLRLAERAFAAREVTPLEILTAQRQVLETQARYLAARREWAQARIRLDSACGRLLPSARTPLPPASAPDSEESP